MYLEETEYEYRLNPWFMIYIISAGIVCVSSFIDIFKDFNLDILLYYSDCLLFGVMLGLLLDAHLEPVIIVDEE